MAHAAEPAGRLWLRRRAADPQGWLAEGQAAGGLGCGSTISHTFVSERVDGVRALDLRSSGWVVHPPRFRWERRWLSGTMRTPSMGTGEGEVCGVWRTQCHAGIHTLISERRFRRAAGKELGGVSAHVRWSPEGAV